jgi:hypothetical protein
MKRQAYGYRDQEFFQLKIYALHKASSPLKKGHNRGFIFIQVAVA